MAATPVLPAQPRACELFALLRRAKLNRRGLLPAGVLLVFLLFQANGGHVAETVNAFGDCALQRHKR